MVRADAAAEPPAIAGSAPWLRDLVYTRAEGFAGRDLVANVGKWDEPAYKGAVATP